MTNLIRSWWDRVFTDSVARDPRTGRGMEMLEHRVLMSAAPRVASVLADNRGQATLTFTRPLDPATVNANTVRILTAGTDGLLDTGDDVAADTAVQYSGNTVYATAPIPAGTKYRVQVTTGVTGINHVPLVGNSGRKGGAGGNFDVETTSQIFIARFNTIAGGMNVALAQNTPVTNANFLRYANQGAWDNSFFSNNTLDGGGNKANFTLQGGSFKIVNDQYDLAPQFAAIKNEPVNRNTLGTLAMAKLTTGADPTNSATNSFFFNLGDNRSRLDGQNGGYTVFGAITDKGGLAVLNNLNTKYPAEDVSTLLDSTNTTSAALNDASHRLTNAAAQMPLTGLSAIAQTGVLDPQRDSVLIYRVAMLMLTKPTQSVGVVIASAARKTSAVPAGARTGGSIFAGG